VTSTIVAPVNSEERVRASFARQKAMSTIGATLTVVTPGMVEMEMPYCESLTQQYGFIQGGIISTALDSACGYAAYSLMPENTAVLTIEFKINFLAPGQGERFLFRGSVTKPGRNIIVADGQAYALAPDGGTKLLATMTATLMSLLGRSDVSEIED